VGEKACISQAHSLGTKNRAISNIQQWGGGRSAQHERWRMLRISQASALQRIALSSNIQQGAGGESESAQHERWRIHASHRHQLGTKESRYLEHPARGGRGESECARTVAHTQPPSVWHKAPRYLEHPAGGRVSAQHERWRVHASQAPGLYKESRYLEHLLRGGRKGGSTNSDASHRYQDHPARRCAPHRHQQLVMVVKIQLTKNPLDGKATHDGLVGQLG
jgi:hypothetical protein